MAIICDWTGGGGEAHRISDTIERWLLNFVSEPNELLSAQHQPSTTQLKLTCHMLKCFIRISIHPQ